MSLIYIFMILLCAIPKLCSAAPVLWFSDITSGPDTGLGDGKGSGAIVTVWGANLGSNQATSVIFFKDSDGASRPAAHVYCWCDADGGISGGGPADLFARHKMQEISFSIPDSANGPGKFYVTVGGETSNELDFTVRSGSIFFTKSTSDGGDDGNSGTWSSPWLTLNKFDSAATSPGAIIYLHDGYTDTDGWGYGMSGAKSGSAAMPYAVCAYPGATVTFSRNDSWAIGSHNSDDDYWHLSKLIVKGAGGGIGTTLGGRIVGCAITDVNDTYLNTMTGFIASPAGRASGAKIYGNYLYECGYDGMYSQVHTIYIYNRSGNEIDPPEIAWNYLKNNMANHGINFYDEGYCGNYTSAVNIHHNVLEHQSGLGIHVQSVDTGYGAIAQDADVNIYSNLLIEPGQGPDYAGAHPVWAMGVSVAGDQLTGHIKFYNNTIFDYSDAVESNTADKSALYVQANFAGTFSWINNIVVDGKDIPYQSSSGNIAPDYHTNNLWYNGGDLIPSSPPSWDTNPDTSDPLFVNASSRNFSLQQNSPANGGGTSPLSGPPFSQYGLYGHILTNTIGACAFASNAGNHAPELSPIGDQNVIIGQTLTFTVSATDQDVGDSLTYNAVPLPGNADFDSTTGQFTWTPAAGDLGDYQVTFTVTDNCNPSGRDEEAVTITVSKTNGQNEVGGGNGGGGCWIDLLLGQNRNIQP